MSGFCVFGISKSLCKKQADKKQETFEFINGGPGKLPVRHEFSIVEWAERRNLLAEKLFDEATRTLQISPKFDSPQFCEDWINSARSEVRNCVIMCRAEKIDKNGGVVVKAGAPVMTWAEYRPENSPSFGPLA